MALRIAIGLAVVVALHGGTIGSLPFVTALIVPIFLGVGMALVLWLGVLGVVHLRAGRPPRAKWIVIVGVEAVVIAAIVTVLFGRLPPTAPTVAGVVAVIVLSTLMAEVAPTLTFDQRNSGPS